MSTELREPTFESFVISGESFAVSGMRMSQQINSVVSCNVMYHSPGSNPVVEVLGQDVFKKAREAQAATFESRNGWDTQLKATDGDDGEFTFNGYVIAPVINHGFGKLSQAATILGEDALVDALDMSIYSLNQKNLDDNSVLLKSLSDTITVVEDWAALLREVIFALMGNYEKKLKRITGAIPKKAMENQHRVNQEAYRVFEAILNNSETIFPEWKRIERGRLLGFKQALLNRMVATLQQKTVGFWGVLRSFMSEYRLVYVPAIEGNGKFIRSRDMTSGEPLSKTISPENTTIGVGNRKLLPLGSVTVTTPLVEGLLDIAEMPPAEVVDNGIVAYPEDQPTGWVHKVGPPPWAVSNGYVYPRMSPGTKPNLTIPGYTADMKLKQQSTLAEYEDSIMAPGGVLGAYAKEIYDEMRLADSTATLTLPLDFSWEIGRRYAFTLPSSATFTGFVTGINHNMEVSGGNSLTVSTTITLTHVDLS